MFNCLFKKYSKNIRYVDIVLVETHLLMFYMDIKIPTKFSNNIIQHTLSVRLGIRKFILVADMPKEATIKRLRKKCEKVLKITRCIKIREDRKNYKIIKSLVKKFQ